MLPGGSPLLVGRSRFARQSFLYLLGAIFIFSFACAFWYAGVAVGLVTRAPGSALFGYTNGTTTIGYYAGVVGFLIIIFEMLLWVRKRLRGRRLGAARTWMFWHIWLGLACLPLAIIHSGFAYGGALTGIIMILFYAVIASGVWGLAFQQIIPKKLLDDIPQETIASERGKVMYDLFEEARALIDLLRLEDADEVDGEVIVKTQLTTYRTKQLISFFDRQMGPFMLATGSGTGPLASQTRARQLFADLRAGAAPQLVATLNRLEAICETRRQLDRQYNLYWWLHSWLCVHLPLSIALLVLLVAHVGYALKFW